MKNITLLALTFLTSSFAWAQPNLCSDYQSKANYTDAIHAVATALQYSDEQLCTLDTLKSVHLLPTFQYDEENQRIDHVLTTLYYETYACQYWVRNDDQVITKKNCYNTW